MGKKDVHVLNDCTKAYSRRLNGSEHLKKMNQANYKYIEKNMVKNKVIIVEYIFLQCHPY